MKKIISTLRDHDIALALEWANAAESRMKRSLPVERSFDWPAILEANVTAIQNSNALIIEGSRFNYSQGYQTALALQYGKPVLNLYREDLTEYKEWPDKLFVSGISSPLFVSKPYKTTDDLTEIVTEFIENITPKTKEIELKLALPIDAHDHLEQLSQETGRSKASLVRRRGENAIEFNVLENTFPSSYDAIYANGVFPHFTPKEMRNVLKNIAQHLHKNGILSFSVKYGTGDEWIREKFDGDRFTHYWNIEELFDLLSEEGYEVVFQNNNTGSYPSHRWLNIICKHKP